MSKNMVKEGAKLLKQMFDSADFFVRPDEEPVTGISGTLQKELQQHLLSGKWRRGKLQKRFNHEVYGMESQVWGIPRWNWYCSFQKFQVRGKPFSKSYSPRSKPRPIRFKTGVEVKWFKSSRDCVHRNDFIYQTVRKVSGVRSTARSPRRTPALCRKWGAKSI